MGDIGLGIKKRLNILEKIKSFIDCHFLNYHQEIYMITTPVYRNGIFMYETNEEKCSYCGKLLSKTYITYKKKRRKYP